MQNMIFKNIDYRLPKQMLYQAELRPDAARGQSLRVLCCNGQCHSGAKVGTNRQHIQMSPEIVPNDSLFIHIVFQSVSLVEGSNHRVRSTL